MWFDDFENHQIPSLRIPINVLDLVRHLQYNSRLVQLGENLHLHIHDTNLLLNYIGIIRTLINSIEKSTTQPAKGGVCQRQR